MSASDFREQRFDERVERVAKRAQAAGGLQALTAAASAVDINTMAAVPQAQWVAPAPRADMAANLADAYGWSMSEEDSRMASAGFNPNNPDDCQRWEAQKRGVILPPAVKYDTYSNPGKTESRDALKKVLADGIAAGVAAVLKSMGITPPVPEPVAVVEGADAPMNEDR